MNRPRRFQDNFTSFNSRIPDRGDEYDYNNSMSENYCRGTTYNNDFDQSNDYNQYNQGFSGHIPRYSSDNMNYDANYDCSGNYAGGSNNRSGSFQDASFHSPSDSPHDYQGFGRSSGFDWSIPPSRSSWGSVGDETRKRHYPDEDNSWGRDAAKQKRVDLDSKPLDLTRPQFRDTKTERAIDCKVCDMTFTDVEMFQVHATSMVHLNNVASAVGKTLTNVVPANSTPSEKSLLGPVPNTLPVARNAFGNVANDRKNVPNRFVNRNPRMPARSNSTDYNNQTGFVASFRETYPSNNNNSNNGWQRNSKQMMGPGQNGRFASEQAQQPDLAKFKPRNGFGGKDAFRMQSFPQKNFQREQPKWKKVKVRNEVKVKKLQGNVKKETQGIPKSAGKSSFSQAGGAKVKSEETGSKPDSSNPLFAADEETKSENENITLEYEDNMDIELNFKPSLPTFKVCDPENAESAKESEAANRTLADREGEDAKTDREDRDKDVPLGQEYVVSVTGFFCKLCSKFYNKESMAKFDHCRSDQHKKNYRKVQSESKEADRSRNAP